ncbi:hypothetical protein ACFXG4_35345 [Nocardia sp. NPDC059246]|uniref:AMP-binding enzyme n=1 Tax=unclassified Nocardia TaxID=2637762 RepID=UPI00367C18D5
MTPRAGADERLPTQHERHRDRLVAALLIDGRDDEMIVSGGENIYPREVENALSEHPAVADVIVVGIADPEYGQVLRAYLVTTDADPGDDALKQHIRTRLERYKVPEQFVRLPELPRNPS